MWIKICANTNLEDALLAAELGADAVGFVFAPSKRQVTAEQVAKIARHLPDRVERVGVFTSREAEAIAEAVRTAGLNAVQLHGGVNLRFVDQLAKLLGTEVAIIQAMDWSVGADAGQALQHALEQMCIATLSPVSDRLLVDAKVAGASGGTGVAFDWAQARAAFRSQPGLRLIVAGGLAPENVGEAIRELRPWGVDVASGVEREPGRKDPERLRRWIEAARAAGRDGD